MRAQNFVHSLLIFFLGTILPGFTLAETDTRQKAIELLRSAGLNKELDAPVKVSADANGIIFIADEGNYFYQYLLLDHNESADPNIIIEPNLKIPASCDKAVIITHGWLDKAIGDWPADIAEEISKKVDPNQWLCAIFDWRGGTGVANPFDAAKYANDVAGPRLAKTLLKIIPKLQHIHLIGHSAGCWTVHSTAAAVAKQTDTQIHLTFLDAYIPPFWNQQDIGKIEADNTIWAEHYYTKDITLTSTQKDLSMAHNIDLSGIDIFFNEHEFPYRWYYATVAGKYRDKDWEKHDEVITKYKNLDYGYERSREAGIENFKKSLTLKKGNEAVKMQPKKTKPLFDFKMFKSKKEQK